MSLDQLLHLVPYACLGVFVLAVVARTWRIARLPLNLRWELYPVAHEKGRAHYGGSYFEEAEWWTKPRETSMLGEMKVMVPEILLLEGVREKNRSHWYRTFPFHFGLYLLVGATACLVIGGLALAFGYKVDGPEAGGLGRALAAITPILGYAGLGLGLLGGLALLLRRLLNRSYREYTHSIDFCNLLFFIVTFAVALGAQLTADPDFSKMRALFASLLSFGSAAPAEGLGFTPLQVAEVVLLSLLAAYVPLTHMSHFFTKWFMYHQIRWSDEPLERGGKIERQVERSLAFKPTWSAPHIRGDGTKNWVDIATSPPVEESGSEKKAP